MKRLISIMLAVVIFVIVNITVFAENSKYINAENDFSEFKVEARSAVLMEANTGKMLFKQNECEQASSASVTKVMTLLLVMEAVSDGRISLTDNVIISSHAASMGGSQVFLEEGESISVEELIKCTVIASANDAAVALAEHTGGSEKLFVSMMNKRAATLGLKNTNFENVTGLDDTTTDHYTSAEDIATMSRELIKYDVVLKYSSMWQDTIRNGEFTLTNTNRLVRFYDGCNGLKTGSTDKAGYCISATAERGGMQLIAVIMGAPTRDIRNDIARQLLDYGFSNYTLYLSNEDTLEDIRVRCGEKDTVILNKSAFSCVIPKSSSNNIDVVYDIPEYLVAPLQSGDKVGKIIYKIGTEEIGSADIYITDSIEKISIWGIFSRILTNIFKG